MGVCIVMAVSSDAPGYHRPYCFSLVYLMKLSGFQNYRYPIILLRIVRLHIALYRVSELMELCIAMPSVSGHAV